MLCREPSRSRAEPGLRRLLFTGFGAIDRQGRRGDLSLHFSFLGSAACGHEPHFFRLVDAKMARQASRIPRSEGQCSEPRDRQGEVYTGLVDDVYRGALSAARTWGVQRPLHRSLPPMLVYEGNT